MKASRRLMMLMICICAMGSLSTLSFETSSSNLASEAPATQADVSIMSQADYNVMLQGQAALLNAAVEIVNGVLAETFSDTRTYVNRAIELGSTRDDDYGFRINRPNLSDDLRNPAMPELPANLLDSARSRVSAVQ